MSRFNIKSKKGTRQARAPRSNFRSIRVQDNTLIRHLRSRHILWLHGWVMGLLTLGVMWVVTTVLHHAGVHSLAVRYALTLGAGYLCYLLLLRIWAGALIKKRKSIGFDISLPDIDTNSQGGNCHGNLDLSSDMSDTTDSFLDHAASGALEAAGAADEGAIVIIPVLAVFAMVLVAVFGVGWLLLAYFSTEVLLTVAVELAFAWTAARTVVRVEREGWLLAALRLTWKPLLGALISAVLLGALIDHFIPQADTLPAAIQSLRAR
ncbi:MAG: hypothetical protein LBV45_05570 [Xanthomonadaceae bacterium]|jgi:hypothetical protein|nr:hypothetical protein [Xanthomonadaceae bacterium]